MTLIDHINYTFNEKERTASVANNQNNEELPNNIEIPSIVSIGTVNYKVTAVEDYAFRGLKAIQSVNLNDNIEKIGYGSFDGLRLVCDLLQLPASIRELGNYGFASNQIKKVKIPRSLSKIGYCPFGGNNVLESIEVEPENNYFCNDNQYALYDKKQTRLIQVPAVLTVLNIPSSVFWLDHQCVDQIGSITTVYINGNIRKFSSASIFICNNIKTIYYSGTTKVGPMLDKTKPKVYVCNNYKGNFSDIEPEHRGQCFTLKKSCKHICSHSHGRLSIFTMILIASK